ncbi:hypothetical protein I316_05685 [Kwoniella heveanensis BCC8398]|uniref:Uncharacterized protein n=1 Tax=Kwoniella heveanensis BCC8398 TaxID=1296120 RepID=A0A1B9GP31_9TREE|nr:hypothetical protein I316_05685 [Kwoniella heveanensis BCC8398]
MPSLADALETLKTQSEQLAYLSTLNSDSPGRFVQAYLHLPPAYYRHGYGYGYDYKGVGEKEGNVLNLIRDASDSERRLFKFVGEDNQNPPPASAASTSAGKLGRASGANGQKGINGSAGGGGGGGNKRVEKRDGGLITPLKDLRRGKLSGNAAAGQGHGGAGTGRDEAEIVLRTALKLVDDYHSMPRARAKIANLLDAHHISARRLAELEDLIAEVSRPGDDKHASESAGDTAAADGAQPDKPKLTPDEAIKAEEAALRALEASLIPLRRTAQSSSSTSASPPPPSSSKMAQSPLPPTTPLGQRTPARGMGDSQAARTPGAGAKEMPHVTNSLVNATPRRIDRFSPLKLLGTPRAPIGTSGLRNEGGGIGDDAAPFATPGSGPALGSSVIGRASVNAGSAGTSESTATPAPSAGPVDPVSADAEDETVRFAPLEQSPASPPSLAPPIDASLSTSASQAAPTTPDRGGVASTEEVTPRAIGFTDTRSEALSSSTRGQQGQTGPANNGLEGVNVKSTAVKAGVAKIWSSLPDMMRQGVQDGPVEPDVTSTVLPSPPSPSNASSHSSISGTTAAQQPPKPITPETILFAHLFLYLLKSYSAATSDATIGINGNGGGEVDMNELKESLGLLAKEKGFEGAGGLGTKMIYAAVGKRVIKIERGKGGSRVRFAD